MESQRIPTREEYLQIKKKLERKHTSVAEQAMILLKSRIRTCIENGLDRCVVVDNKHGVAEKVLVEMNKKSYNARFEYDEENRTFIVWDDLLPTYEECLVKTTS